MTPTAGNGRKRPGPLARRGRERGPVNGPPLPSTSPGAVGTGRWNRPLKLQEIGQRPESAGETQRPTDATGAEQAPWTSAPVTP